MKPSDYPEQDTRTVPFQGEEKEIIPARRLQDQEARYLDVPKSPEQATATRNLGWAIACLCLAAIGYWLGLYYAGAAATRTLLACLATFGVLWLLLNFNILRQRYGPLLALGLTLLVGAAIPFIEGGFRNLDDLAREKLTGKNDALAALSVPPPPMTTATAPPAPPTIPMPEMEGDNFTAIAAAEPAQAAPPAAAAPAPAPKKAALATRPVPGEPNVRELIVPEPDMAAGRLIRVKEDVKVDLDGRPTIIRGGTIAPFKDFSDGEVTFVAGDHEIRISADFVTFTGASREKPEDITRMAHQEVARRYPKLGEKDSPENILFLVRTKELQMDPEMKAVFFQDPKWPLVLGEQLAEQENWVRADLEPPVAAEDAAPETAEIPENELPALPAKGESESLLTPGAPPIPQESEPPPAE